MTLTILEILYIVLIIFSTIIGTLLIVILIKIIKVLGPIVEVANFYNKIKGILVSYANIPEKVKEKFFSTIRGKKDNENDEIKEEEEE